MGLLVKLYWCNDATDCNITIRVKYPFEVKDYNKSVLVLLALNAGSDNLLLILLATKLTTLLLLVMISIDTIGLRRLYDTTHPIKLTI